MKWSVGFVVSLVLLSSLLFSSPQAFWSWAIGSIQTAIGYNSYMVTEKGVLALALPVVAFLALVHKPRHFLLILPFSPLLFCLMKYGWVRQGVEPFLYALVLVAAFMLDGLAVEWRRIATVSVTFILAGYVFIWPRFFAAGQTYVAFPFGVNPLGVLRSVALPSTMEKSKLRADVLLAVAALPRDFRNAIGDATVQLLPHEFAPAMADPTLNVVPFSTMQMYLTYTAWLDDFAADSYKAANAPEFIVVDSSYLAIDDKNAFLDSPRTWAAIRSNYSLQHMSEDRRWLLLKRRCSPRPIVYNRQIDVPIETTMDKIVAFFFRGKLHYADIKTSSGTIERFRVNPSVLKEPVDRDLPLDAAEIAEYFR